MPDRTPNQHILENFEEILVQLHADLMTLGNLVGEQLIDCKKMLQDSNDDRAVTTLLESAVSREEQINHLDLKISDGLANCFAMHQPIGRDVRTCLGMVRSSLDLERIGDESLHVAEFFATIRQELSLPDDITGYLLELLDLAQISVINALNAWSSTSSKTAEQVITDDVAINEKEQGLYQLLISRLKAQDLPIEVGVILIRAARSLERIGDHSKNLAQSAIYRLTGRDTRHPEAAPAKR